MKAAKIVKRVVTREDGKEVKGVMERCGIWLFQAWDVSFFLNHLERQYYRIPAINLVTL
jgi:hypothetical protein